MFLFLKDRKREEQNIASKNGAAFSILCTCLLGVFLSLISGESFAETSSDDSVEVFNYLGPGPKLGYDRALINLVLSKTSEKWGAYKLVHAPPMSEARARKIAGSSRYPNAIRSDVTDDLVLNDEKLRYLPFPIYFGILGYRVCFVPKDEQAKLERLESFEAFKPYYFGQVVGWRDADIFRENGLQVREAPEVKNLYDMLNAKRVDIFCRGINEVLNEKDLYARLDNIDINHSFAFYYPLPIFYYINSSNTKLYDRLYEGLITSYNDGSMKKLWRMHFQSSVDHTELSKRKVYTLKNSYTDSIPFEYDQFIYHPDEI